MDIDQAQDFFRSRDPFEALDEGGIKKVTSAVALEFYPRGAFVLRQDGPPSDGLRIVRSGSVRVTVPLPGEKASVSDYRGEGDLFGFLSLLTGDGPRGDSQAMEDTSCYLLDRETLLDLLRTQPVFGHRFFKKFLEKYVELPGRELGRKRLHYNGGERLLFTTPVGELARRDLLTAAEDISIREAAGLMSKYRVGSLVLLDAQGLPSGIVTNKDLRDRVVSKGRDVGQPVRRIQSVSLVKAEAGEHCIEALSKMLHYAIHHLLVVENGSLKGIITDQDMMKLQGNTPLSLAREIEAQSSLEALGATARRIRNMLGVFIREGVKASHLLGIQTELHDRLLQRVLFLVEKKAGPPPVPLCLLCLGAAGRQEEALLVVQQHGLLYGDASGPSEEKAVAEHAAELSGRLGEALEGMGIRASGGIGGQADTLQAWKNRFSDWFRRPHGRSASASLPYFDFRCIQGDRTLAEALRDAVFGRLHTRPEFLNAMALTILKNSPPLNPFRGFVLEKEGPFKGTLDLCGKGLQPLVDAVRLLSLEAGVRATSTLERLKLLKGLSPLVTDYGEELAYAFSFMSGLLLRMENDPAGGDSPFGGRIAPMDLNDLERKSLRDVFALISRIQGAILEKYRPIKI